MLCPSDPTRAELRVALQKIERQEAQLAQMRRLLHEQHETIVARDACIRTAAQLIVAARRGLK